MEPMTPAENAAYDANRAAIDRFMTLSGVDFHRAVYASDLIAKAVPGATITSGSHEDRYAETMVWHTPEGGWEALTIDPYFTDEYCLSWPDSDWDRRSTYFHDALAHGLLVAAHTPAALAEALIDRVRGGDELDGALAVLTRATPAGPDRDTLADILSAHGLSPLAEDKYFDLTKPDAAA